MAKLLSQISVSTTPPAVETNFNPQLLIPCEAPYRDESRHHFPCINAIKARHAAQDVRLFEEFAKAISTAQQVLIIDKHLFSADGKNPDHSRRFKKVQDWFYTENIETVKILTGHHDSQKEIEREFEKLTELITESRGKVAPPITIKLSFSLGEVDYIHDRFAIIDNELWHFGATVGGFHRDVNAASRGWNAHSHNAVHFFDTAWTMANDRRRK